MQAEKEVYLPDGELIINNNEGNHKTGFGIKINADIN